MLPDGMKNAVAVYASSTSTSLSAYADLLGHHLRSTLDLIATPPVSTYPKEISSDKGMWAGTDFSSLGDLETLFHFLESSNYCFGYSEFDGDNYDLSRECFHLETDVATPISQGSVGPVEHKDVTPPPIAVSMGCHEPRGAASAPVGPRCPNLEQFKELEAKLEEDRRHLRQLHETLVQDQYARWNGGAARRCARDINRCIIEDARGEDPPLFSTTS